MDLSLVSIKMSGTLMSHTGSVSGRARLENTAGGSGLNGSLVGGLALASSISGTASGSRADGCSNARLSTRWDGLGGGHGYESQESE